jgi:Tol biopolymer transport system component
VTRPRPLPLLAFAAALVVGSAPARAQLPADARWRTIEATHFRVTYHEGLEDLARHAAASAERAHAALAVLVAEAPAGIIDIVVSDNIDLTNGYATPFPSNRIVVYARPPANVLELQYVRDWIDLVIVHELAHIFHLDVTNPVGRLVRRIFGRVPAPWPVFPAVGSPLWSVEGLAVAIESAVAGHGRVHGSYHEMIVRTAALQDRIDDFERLSSATPVWPGPSRVYIYGSLFFDYLHRRYGADVAGRLVRATAGSIVPAPLWFGNVGRTVLGISFRDAYGEWREELQSRYAHLAADLTAAGLTAGEPLTRHGAYALHPRFSPDGRQLVYSASDWRSTPRTRILDVATGRVVASRRRNDTGTAAWLPDGRLLTAYIDYVDPFRIYGDLYLLDGGDEHRLTRAARLQDVDASANSRAVAVENRAGTNRLVLVDITTGAQRPLTEFDPDVTWSLPRFAPAGDRIAAGRWRLGGRYDIVVMDTLGAELDVFSAGAGISAAPAWSPDARWLLFWSDRTGVPNLFAVDTGTGELRQVTNVLTGAFYPDVSPDGRWIAFSAYHHDGFRVERMPFDPAAWRAPMDTAPAEPAIERGEYLQAARTAALLDSARTAMLLADTMTGTPGAYRGLGHARPRFWVPYIATGGTDDLFLGVASFGQDLVSRHYWDAALGVEPGSGRTQGRLSYTFRGLPVIRALSLHPVLSFVAARDWDVYLASDSAGRPFIDEREDAASATLGLSRARWRAITGLNATGELVRRSRYLYNVPDSLRLRDPDDDLLGIRVLGFFSNAATPPLALGRENGITLQLAARRRWEREPRTTTIDGRDVVIDASYSELTSWNAAYLAFPWAGFARHVLAARASGLYRHGPGGGLSNIGGPSSTGLTVPGIPGTIAGASTLLPVRGFDRGVRHGDRAWTASAEYRFPIALLTRSLRPLPVYLDRLGAALFLDAGHAWCDPATAAALPDSFCPFTDARAAPLVGTGAELLTRVSVFGVPLPLRFGAALPVSGETGGGLHAHFLVGHSF